MHAEEQLKLSGAASALNGLSWGMSFLAKFINDRFEDKLFGLCVVSPYLHKNDTKKSTGCAVQGEGKEGV